MGSKKGQEVIKDDVRSREMRSKKNEWRYSNVLGSGIRKFNGEWRQEHQEISDGWNDKVKDDYGVTFAL